MASSVDPGNASGKIVERHCLGSVAVIGAGVSGLTAAYKLRKEGVNVTVFESQPYPGGAIRSFSKDGFIWERAANTMASNSPVVEEIIADLALTDKRLFPQQQNKRFIVKDGIPELIPTNPVQFLATKLLSTGAKVRLLAEPFMWKPRRVSDKSEGEESVRSFLERHIGKEPVDYLADPFCAGTAGSDVDSLAVKYSFPQLWELEQKYGSLVVGAFKSALLSQKERKQASEPKVRPPRGSFSFLGGMQVLPNSLADRVGSHNIRLNTAVQHLNCSQQGNPSRNYWKLSTLSSDGDSGPHQEMFDAVILTAPLHSVAHMTFTRDGLPYTPALPPVKYQPMSMLVNAFHAQDVERPLPGFGVLIPSVEQRRHGFQSLGTLFSSFMFPDRAPSDEILFSTFVGGSRNAELSQKPSQEIQEVVLRDLKRLFGIRGAPLFSQHICWKNGFPEYGVHYGKVLEAINTWETDLPGFYYAGNHRGGLAVGRAMTAGYSAAEAVREHLIATGGMKIFTMADATQSS